MNPDILPNPRADAVADRSSLGLLQALESRANFPLTLASPTSDVPVLSLLGARASEPARITLPRAAASWQATAEKKASALRFGFRAVRVFMLSLTLLLGGLHTSIGAEEWARFEAVEYAPVFSPNDSFRLEGGLWQALDAKPLPDPAHLGSLELSTVKFALQLREKNGLTGTRVALMSKRLASRYQSGAWADLQTGYGDVFDDDRAGRPRLNGAGIQDPDSLYLKLSFRF